MLAPCDLDPAHELRTPMVSVFGFTELRIFERFYRADPSGNIPGTGLGMCLVKEIVELQHGRVELQGEPGRGTVVTLWWPRPGPAKEGESEQGRCDNEGHSVREPPVGSESSPVNRQPALPPP